MLRKLPLLILVSLLSLSAFGCATTAQSSTSSRQFTRVQRYGMVIGIKPEKIEYYRYLHANPWPSVAKKITECNIHNFVIYLRELEPNKYYLFGYFEYTGNDFDADMKKMAADPETQRWWKETDPCQYTIPTAKKGEKWSMMEEVFFQP